MKIVIFGDSNTWGFDPLTGLRRPVRFVSELKKMHPGWQIAEDGKNGRLMASSDPYFGDLNGAAQLKSFLLKETPYDLLVIALGSNDARRMFHRSLHSWLQAFQILVRQAKADNELAAQKAAVQSGKTVQEAPILFVQPPLFNSKAVSASLFEDSYGESGRKILANLETDMKDIAQKAGCLFLGTSSYGIEGGEVDGIHLEDAGHRKLAAALCEIIEALQKAGIIPLNPSAKTV